MTPPTAALTCPFCGCPPIPHPKGFAVSCNTPGCAIEGHTENLKKWNRRAPAVQATADAAAREIVAGDLFDPEYTGWSLNTSVSREVVTERIAAIIRKHSAVSPKAARELNLKWGRHDGRGEYHIEWHAPCGCAYHPEPKPHVHPCIKHSPIEDALHDLREMWLNFPGLSFGSLSIPCIQEMSPEQADFYEKACEIAKASPAAVSGDKQEKERG